MHGFLTSNLSNIKYWDRSSAPVLLIPTFSSFGHRQLQFPVKNISIFFAENVRISPKSSTKSTTLKRYYTFSKTYQNYQTYWKQMNSLTTYYFLAVIYFYILPYVAPVHDFTDMALKHELCILYIGSSNLQLKLLYPPRYNSELMSRP